MEHLQRYADIVDDPSAFYDAAASPLGRVVWANPLRGDLDATARTIREHWPGARPLGWMPHAWRLPADARPGSTLGHLLGDWHVQEEAALWAVPLLGARPGERVLDLCAAPGNKTAQLAVAMADRGTLVANERKRGRLAALRRNLDRLGVSCAVVTHADGMRLRGEALYDRVLVDVPCTCEGTSRKLRGARTEPAREGHRASIVQVQKALLRRALKLVRPGGTVVYATCTYAPEENEAVLHAIPESDAAIEPIEAPPGLRLAPGVTEWAGRRFRADVRHAARMWPHHNDTGGFFVARLRRPAGDGSPAPGPTEPSHFLPLESREAVGAELALRFGVPEGALSAHRLWRRDPGDTAWCVAADCVPPSDMRIETVGFLAMRGPPRGKVTSLWAMRFGHLATRHVVDIEPTRALAWLAGEVVPASPGDRGYYIVKVGGRPIGLGLVVDGALTCALPKAWRAALRG